MIKLLSFRQNGAEGGQLRKLKLQKGLTQRMKTWIRRLLVARPLLSRKLVCNLFTCHRQSVIFVLFTFFLLLQLQPDQFVLAKWGNLPWVASILNVHVQKRTVELTFLRPYLGRKDVFTYPNIPDIDELEITEINRILPQPSNARGRVQFGYDVFSEACS